MKKHEPVINKALSNLTKPELLLKTKKLADEERRITLELIEHLREIESRLLFLELGYGSLFEFCIKYLNLSKGSIHRRVSAMHLMKSVPEVSEKLKTGELSLTNAARIETAFQAVLKKGVSAQVKSTAQEVVAKKKEVIEQCLGVSQNECEENLLTELPELVKTPLFCEQKRTINAETVEIKLVISKSLQEKIEKLNLIHSHSNPEQSYIKLFEKLIDQELDAKSCKTSDNKTSNRPTAGNFEKTYSGNSRYIPAKVKAEIFSRSKNDKGEPQCEFQTIALQNGELKDDKTRCTSRYQLEIDHIQPISTGGKTELSNLRVLCKKHNSFESVRKLGMQVMQPYLFKGN